MKRIVIHVLLIVPIIALLSVVFITNSALPSGELLVQWAWLAKTCILFTIFILIVLLVSYKTMWVLSAFYPTVIWTLILLGGGQAIYGLRQIYGYASSHHSLFVLTGSFFNPGPYSGYLAMILPLCLNEWLQLRAKVNRSYIEQVAYYLAGGVMLLILCVLPTGMSRSAWLAVSISGLWIYGMHYSWGLKLQMAWQEHCKKVIAITTLGLICMVMGGVALFYLKEDSANGRLFIWKIVCRAIAKRPVTGYGVDGFGCAYGRAQEEYFEKGEYTSQEEMVAGSPEYAFNEYLQVIIEWGAGLSLVAFIVIGICLWRGIMGKRLSACGGVISLLVFAFSSYPMQLPTFVITFFLLLAACVIGHSRMTLTVFTFFIGWMGVGLWKGDVSKECQDWTKVKMLYDIGAYDAAKKAYQELYPALKGRGPFLFEYGHCLHKLKEYDASTGILKEAESRNCDPMILNIIGKNFQQQQHYDEAEEYFIRSTHRLPGRIYPYYLLAKLYAECGRAKKMQEMAGIVLTKEPKVQSTAVREMREEMRKLINNNK